MVVAAKHDPDGMVSKIKASFPEILYHLAGILMFKDLREMLIAGNILHGKDEFVHLGFLSLCFTGLNLLCHRRLYHKSSSFLNIFTVVQATVAANNF